MKERSPKIRLVSFATRQYMPRQFLLELSARWNCVVAEAERWTPSSLKSAGFEKELTGISLKERGSGFWAWKPFIICETMKLMNEGDLLLYCDVGRTYPIKLLEQSLDPFLKWMDDAGQDVMPGIEIPWKGSMIHWTKRDALVSMGMDKKCVHISAPIQASFSVWRVTQATSVLATEWKELCSDRQLISDDPSIFPAGEHQGFLEHRHDQALWSLLCRKRGIQAISLGKEKPSFDEKNPSEVASYLTGSRQVRFSGCIIRVVSKILEKIERLLRSGSNS